MLLYSISFPYSPHAYTYLVMFNITNNFNTLTFLLTKSVIIIVNIKNL